MVLTIAAVSVLVLSAIQIKISIYRENENERLIKNIERHDREKK
tara:strand:+ start:1500 stop:1631 length:132 start_codon:yes stop_codon:yes gene_type:complete